MKGKIMTETTRRARDGSKFIGIQLDLGKYERLHHFIHVHILRDQLSSPIILRSERKNVTISMIGSDKDEALSTLNSLVNGNKRDIKEVILGAISTIRQRLLISGRTRYEIVNNESETYLTPLHETKLYKLGNIFIQLVPKQFRPQFERTVITGYKSRIWELHFPHKVCSYRSYRKILNLLSIEDNISNSTDTSNDNSFDFNLYQKSKEKIILKALNKIGGTQRESCSSYINEFYYGHRFIRLQITKKLIFEHIKNELNALFLRLKIDSKIAIEGLKSSEDLIMILRDLEAGNLNVQEAVKRSLNELYEE